LVLSLFATSGQEMEQIYSYNPGGCTGLMTMNRMTTRTMLQYYIKCINRMSSGHFVTKIHISTWTQTTAPNYTHNNPQFNPQTIWSLVKKQLRSCLLVLEGPINFSVGVRLIWSICTFDQKRCAFDQMRCAFRQSRKPNLIITLLQVPARLTKCCVIRQMLCNW